MRIVFFGTPQFVIPVLEKLCQNYDVLGVVTSPDQKVGRKQTLTPSPVKVFAEKSKLSIFTPEKLDEEFVETLRNLNPDLLVVAAYGKIIPQAVLDIPKYGALNIHPSLLPKYRGASPLQSALLNGDKSSAITIMKMDQKMDHGPIITQTPFDISEQDNFQTLSTKVFADSAEVLMGILDDYITGKIKIKEQVHDDATFTKIIKKEDGYFDFSSPPSLEILDRMIRAYYPWPNVWTKWNEKVVKFLPGKLVQIEGKKPTPLENFLNGYPDFPIKEL